jgi:fatty-acyl-CoA synthase
MELQRLATAYRMIKYGIPLARLKPNRAYSVADLIESQAARRGTHPVVVFEDRRVSYRDYNAEANRVAHWALEMGLRAGDVVALLMQNRPEYLSTWGGLSKLGVTTALINTNLAGRALSHAIDAAGTRRLIVGSECVPSLETLQAEDAEGLEVWVAPDPADPGPSAYPLGARDFGEAIAGKRETNPDRSLRAEVRAGDPLTYIYTSGTTGLPKAAKMSHLRFNATGVGSQIAGFGPDDIMYCALPLYHSAGGAMAVMAVLRSGGTLALRRRFSASAFWDDVCRFDATAFQYIGEFCRYLLNQPPTETERQHRIKFAIGNGLRPDIWEQFRDRFAIPRIVEFYGATEGNVAMLNYDNKVGSVGKKPPAFVSAPRLIRYDVENDAHPRNAEGLCIECGPDEVGELIGEIPRDPNTAQGRFEGYTSKEATDRKILRDVFKKGDTWFRTGDLLRCDRAGYFYFIDRIGDTFRWKGENVSTQEVAEAVGVYPGTEMVNAYGVDVEGAEGRAGMVAMVLQDPGAFDGKAFYKLVAESLPAYAAPVFVRLQQEAEITGTFKLRKVDLQEQGYDPSVVKDPLYVRDDSAEEYVPLTPERLAAVKSGALRV